MKQYRAPGACRLAAALHHRLVPPCTAAWGRTCATRPPTSAGPLPEPTHPRRWERQPASWRRPSSAWHATIGRSTAAAQQLQRTRCIYLVCICSSLRHSSNCGMDAGLRCAVLCDAVLCSHAVSCCVRTLQHGSTARLLPLSQEADAIAWLQQHFPYSPSSSFSLSPDRSVWGGWGASRTASRSSPRPTTLLSARAAR